MKKIKLTQGKYAIVDNEDYHYLSRFNWCYAKGGADIGMVMTMISQKSIYIHELILPTKKGFYLKHYDGDPLNNTKKNLLLISINHKRHSAQKKIQGYSKYRGVWKRRVSDQNPFPWEAVIAKNKQRYYLGFFEREEDAAKVYNEKAKELYGAFAYQNKI